MAGVATAYSTDALTSSGGVDNEKWEFAVPLPTDVGFFHWISPPEVVVGDKRLLAHQFCPVLDEAKRPNERRARPWY